MKNQYFGDVNDYLKYGILRVLSITGALKIGVCWMLTPDDGSSQGGSRGYAKSPGKWRQFDSNLFDFLCSAQSAKRSVGVFSESGLLGSALFYDAIVPRAPDERSMYFSHAIKALEGSDLIFFDPDNGIEVQSVTLRSKSASKYIFWPELIATISHGQSVLIYQHFPRENRRAFINRTFANIRDKVGKFDLYAIATSNVVFFLIAQRRHADQVQMCISVLALAWLGPIQVVSQTMEL